MDHVAKIDISQKAPHSQRERYNNLTPALIGLPATWSPPAQPCGEGVGVALPPGVVMWWCPPPPPPRPPPPPPSRPVVLVWGSPALPPPPPLRGRVWKSARRNRTIATLFRPEILCISGFLVHLFVRKEKPGQPCVHFSGRTI